MTRIGIAIAALVSRLIVNHAAAARSILIPPRSHTITISGHGRGH